MNTTPFTASTCEAPLVDSAIARTLGSLDSTRGLDLGHLEPFTCDVQQWRTEEGAEVRFVASRSRPMFDLALRFRAGSMLDGATPGLAALALFSLDQGTERLDAVQFAQHLEGLGASMSRQIRRDHALVTLRGLSTPPLRDAALHLITQMVARPALRADYVEKIRTRLRNYHASRIQTGRNSLNDTTMGHLFAGHPYADLPAGTSDGLARITLEQLKAFHHKAYSANNVDIALVGDLSRNEAETFITELVKTLPQNWAATPAPPLPTTIVAPLHMTSPGSNTKALLTQPLHITPACASYGALLLANNILGAGIESRLAAELRTRRALTYSISSELVPMDGGCLWQIKWDIAPELREASRELVANVLGCFIAHGPSEAERELALNKLAGELLRTMPHSALLAQDLSAHPHQGLPADHLSTLLPRLAALTVEDIRLAARDWLSVQQACFVTHGPTVYQQPLPKPSTMDA